jgi:NADH-quinone oxidoreductase subunit H
MTTWILPILLRFVLIIGLMLVNGIVLIYMLRKVLGYLHVRMGPMELGPHGVFQTIADVLKLLTKEDVTPAEVDPWLFRIAPAAVFVPSLMAYIALPFGVWLGWDWVGANLEAGLFYTFAIASLVPLGILMAGWASSNKWSLLGGMRAVAAQIAYEVPLLLSVVGIVMVVGSMDLSRIVEAQQGWWLFVIPRWFILPQFPAFVLFLIAMLAEINQTPFDMSEAESELIAGFATEYSAMKFGLLFLAEFSNAFVMSALAATVFFGGWHSGLPQPIAGWIDGPLVLLLKAYAGLFVLFWIRGTLPRVRIDQMLGFAWKGLIPAGLLWVLLTGIVLKVVG